MINANHLAKEGPTSREQALAELTKSRIRDKIWSYVGAAIFGAYYAFAIYRDVPHDISTFVAGKIGLAAFLGLAAMQENRQLRLQMKAVIAYIQATEPPVTHSTMEEQKPVRD